MWEIVGAFFLIVIAILAWGINVFGLPGNWLIVGSSAGYAYFTSGEGRTDIGWQVVIVLLVLAALGELVEFAAGALGATKAGGSKRGAVLAMVGSLVGGIAGAFGGVAIPIPIIGSLVGALLFASLGALIGAMLGEELKGRDLNQSFRVGQAAFWGRLLGTLGKIVVGAVMIAVLLVAVIV